MGTTKKKLADELGVDKQTVTNHLKRLGLEEHVERVGQTDYLDDYAVSAVADSIRKSVPERASRKDVDGSSQSSSIVDAYETLIGGLKDENARLRADLEDERERHEREVDDLRRQVVEANERADDAHRKLSSLTERLVETQERQQMIAVLPWWKRGAIAMRLLTSGRE